MYKQIILILLAILTISCGKSSKNEVIVYCTVDQVFSEPVLQDFERETGITVKSVFDTEETKSTGIMNRLIAEQNNPQCDVFWSGDPIRNNVLKSKGITASHSSDATRQIAEHFKDKDNHWIGFSARARVLIYNKNRIHKDSLPQGLNDLLHPRYKGEFAIANPLFGTTTFHMASLFSVWGEDKSKQWISFRSLNTP